jgi:hypothetical protein
MTVSLSIEPAGPEAREVAERAFLGFKYAIWTPATRPAAGVT